MRTLNELIESRDGDGFVRISGISHSGASMAGILKALGLKPDPGALTEVDREVASRCIASLLARSLAYGHVRYLGDADADACADLFLRQHAPRDASFHVNGRWDRYHAGAGGGWSELSAATFGAVVLVVGPSTAACLLVEEED